MNHFLRIRRGNWWYSRAQDAKGFMNVSNGVSEEIMFYSNIAMIPSVSAIYLECKGVPVS